QPSAPDRAADFRPWWTRRDRPSAGTRTRPSGLNPVAPVRRRLERFALAHLGDPARRGERITARVGPERLEYRVVRNAGQKVARLQEAVQRRQRAHLERRHPPQDVLGPDLAWMAQARRTQQVAQR